jgi:hypothetical protein
MCVVECQNGERTNLSGDINLIGTSCLKLHCDLLIVFDLLCEGRILFNGFGIRKVEIAKRKAMRRWNWIGAKSLIR